MTLKGEINKLRSKMPKHRPKDVLKYPHRLSGRILTLPTDESLLKLQNVELDGPMIASAISRSQRIRALMKEHGGIAIAANQVGLNWRAFWTRLSDLPLVINPVLTFVSEKLQQEQSESCLSDKGYIYRVRPPEEIELMYFDGSSMRKRRFAGYYAQIICHEMKHINGKIPSRDAPDAD